MQDTTGSADNARRHEPRVTTEGQILLDALKLFMASFSNSTHGPQMAGQLPRNSDQEYQDTGLSLQCILMLPMINADKMDSVDEETNMDIWESSGLDLIVPGGC